jgi:hypothetical protein
MSHLEKGASTVYAGTRQPLTHPAARVKPLPLDVTVTAQIEDAAPAGERDEESRTSPGLSRGIWNRELFSGDNPWRCVKETLLDRGRIRTCDLRVHEPAI